MYTYIHVNVCVYIYIYVRQHLSVGCLPRPVPRYTTTRLMQQRSVPTARPECRRCAPSLHETSESIRLTTRHRLPCMPAGLHTTTYDETIRIRARKSRL